MKKRKKKKYFYFSVILFSILLLFFSFIFLEKKKGENLIEKELIRESAVAGKFYPSLPAELDKKVSFLLEKNKKENFEGEIISLIVPHAGYDFSGEVAASAFRQLEGEEIETVIIIGNSHYFQFDGISVFPKGKYKTPLGEIEIDEKLAKKLISCHERIFFNKEAHLKEHSIEVELPFLQKVLKDFKIVPILFGNSSSNEDWKILSDAILKNIKGKNVLLIASSDLSHYPPYEIAKKIDKKTIDAILTLNVDKIEERISQAKKEDLPNVLTLACGLDAIKTVVNVSKELGAFSAKLIKYTNSGEVSPNKDRVVGYGAIVILGERRGNLLNKKERKKLLEIAKESVESFIREGKIPEFEIKDPFLNQKLGAFVTLKKHGILRGCIGTFTPSPEPLYKVVSQMAISAATKDIRFPPVREDELPDLEYEISVLSPLEKIDNIKEIKLGKHGVMLKYGLASGTFLPQVARETNWNLEEFLGNLCVQKLRLSFDCWKKKDIEIFIFTAQVFK